MIVSVYIFVRLLCNLIHEHAIILYRPQLQELYNCKLYPLTNNDDVLKLL